MKSIGERIKELRLEAGMTQEELAQKIGYKSRTSINKIELARSVPMPKLEKFAKALGCSPAYLMGWTDEEDAKKTAASLVENSELRRLILFAGENIPTAFLESYVNALIKTIEALNEANKKTPQ